MLIKIVQKNENNVLTQSQIDDIFSSETRTLANRKKVEKVKFNYSKLRGKIKEVFNTQDKFAEALGIGRVSLSQRLNNILEFSQNEIYISCKLLGIQAIEIADYFFCLESSETRTE